MDGASTLKHVGILCRARFSDVLYALVGYCNYLLEQDVKGKKVK